MWWWWWNEELVGEGEATLLPLLNDEDDRGKSRSAAEMAAAESAERSRGGRVLPVEDDADADEAAERVRASAGG